MHGRHRLISSFCLNLDLECAYISPLASYRRSVGISESLADTTFSRPESRETPLLPTSHVSDRYWLHAALFLATLASTIYAGAELAGRWLLYSQPEGWVTAAADGLRYSLSLLFFLTVHEFGHYFAARVHSVRVTLPYYIPSPFFFIPFNIGTFGAVIRIRDQVPTSRKLFDIGVAGPIAGFIAALVVLLYGLMTLPDAGYYLDLPGHNQLKDLIYRGEPLPAQSPTEFPVVYIGTTPLFWLLSTLFPQMPPLYELYHFPILFAGWLGLFFTALNLLPVGQLDGGHILYALVGRVWHGRLARAFVLLLLLSAGIGFVTEMGTTLDSYMRYGGLLTWIILSAVLYFFVNRIFDRDLRLVVTALALLVLVIVSAVRVGTPITDFGYSGWFFWCALIVLFIKVDHPPVLYHEPLTRGRRWLGILSFVIFALCFSVRPIYVA